jgi:tetratricopeptide (TPR) repeat protein
MGRRIFRVVGVLLILGLSIGIGLKWKADAEAADEALKLSRLKPFVEVAAVPVPKGIPLLGEAGVSAEGFPLQWVDQAGLRSLLFHRRFAALDAAFAHFQDAFEKDPRFERWPADAADAFGSAEPRLGVILDDWVRVSPQSFAPWLVRGTHRAAVAQAQRGTKWSKDTLPGEFEEMRATLPAAKEDLEKALSLRPKLVAALSSEFQVLSLAGEGMGLIENARRADELCPSCFLHRIDVIQSLRPRWGGSVEAMRGYARRAPVADNPRFKLLEGYIPLDEAATAIEEGRSSDALASSDEALAFGEHWAFLKVRGHVRRHRKEYDAALVDLSRALELRPGNPDVLIERAEVYLDQGHAELAGVDFVAAVRVNPSHARAEQLYGQLVQSLIHEAWEHHKAGRRLDALRVLDLASELAPLDGSVLEHRGFVQQAVDAGIPELRAAADAKPDDLRTIQALDYALGKAQRLDEALELWNQYLARNPEDGRAYMERAGTFNHLHRRPETMADLEKACEFGVTEGCARLKR